jgi:hypothetical protein
MEGPNLALVFPNDATARKWTGALEARLRRARRAFRSFSGLLNAGRRAARTIRSWRFGIAQFALGLCQQVAFRRRES